MDLGGDGLRVIISDGDTLVMQSVVDRFKTFVLYFDHEFMMTFYQVYCNLN